MKSKRNLWAIAAAILLAAAALFHHALLRGLTRPLVACQPSGDFDYVGMISRTEGPDGDRCFDAAARLLAEDPRRRLLVVGAGPVRLIEMGVLPPFEKVVRRELARRGVTVVAISVVPGDGDRYAAAAVALAAWLDAHRDARVLLLCSQFRSAHTRRALNAAISASQADRARICPLSDRRFDESNWWKCRPGWREVGIAWLIRLQGLLGDGQAAQPLRKTTNQYEEDFQRSVTNVKEQTK